MSLTRLTETERSRRVQEAIGAIYDAALRPASWPEALAQIAACTQDVGALLLWSKGGGTFGTIASPALSAAQAVYAESWSHRDVQGQRAVQYGSWLADEVVTDFDVITPDEMAADPFYTEFLAAFDLKWCAAVAVSHDGGAFQAALSVQRGIGHERFDGTERETIRVLGRHVETSLRIGRELIDRRAVTNGLAEVLRRLDIAVFALDHDMRILFANDAAQGLPAEAVSVRDGRLALLKDGRRVSLRASLEMILGATSGEAFPLAPFLLTGPDEEQIVVYVVPITPSDWLTEVALGSAQMLVVASRRPRGAPLDVALLRDLFGLTPAEARLAAIMGEGTSRKLAARQLQISEETVKSTLNRIFAKTGTSRQSELAAYLGSVALRA